MTTNRRPPMLALAASLALLSGCSSFGPVTSGTDDPCATLQSVVADYTTGFDAYRGNGSSYAMVTLYRAKEQLIKGHCEIWEWGGNGDAAYTCTVGAPNQEVATAMYQQANNQLSACLGGENWQGTEAGRERDGRPPAGEVTRYQNSGKAGPAVSLHRVQDRSQHSVYLYIGTPPGRSPPEPAN